MARARMEEGCQAKFSFTDDVTRENRLYASKEGHRSVSRSGMMHLGYQFLQIWTLFFFFFRSQNLGFLTTRGKNFGGGFFDVFSISEYISVKILPIYCVCAEKSTNYIFVVFDCPRLQLFVVTVSQPGRKEGPGGVVRLLGYNKVPASSRLKFLIMDLCCQIPY